MNTSSFIGMIKGMQEMGAKYVKVDSSHLFFDVTKGSDIDDDKKLKIAQEAFMKIYGLGLRIKRVE